MELLKRQIMDKKAYYLSLDAFIALVIIVGVVLLIKPSINTSSPEVHSQEDLLKVLSSINIGELENNYTKELISEGKITNLNQSVLEQLGDFYAASSPEAELLAENILDELNTDYKIGLYFNNQKIAETNDFLTENKSDVWVSRQIISGIRKGDSVKGYSSRALLSSANKVKYFYFGGYVGDGVITAKINYEGEIINAYIEAAFSEQFDLYINNQYINRFTPTGSSTPYKINLNNYSNYFNSGDNLIEFKPISSQKFYVAGGYIRIIYSDDGDFELAEKHNLPGIKGTINLYDSFYVPGELNSLSAHLHYNSSYQVFFNIGNKTVYENFSTGETTINLDNSLLSPMLDYQQLSEKTIPIRFGLKQLKLIGKTGNADIVLITDLSGSMNSKMNSDDIGVTRNCSDPLLFNSGTKRLSVARCLDKDFIDTILNVSGNRVALSAFYGDENSPYKGRVRETLLSNNSVLLKGAIDSYAPQGGTCICCSINHAYKMLNEHSSNNRTKFIIVMSDGIPTHTCQAASGCEGTRTGLPSEEGLWLGYGAGCYGGLDDCENNDCSCASKNANWSSCRAHQNLNATLYSVGFGPITSCSMAANTLNNIANCGGGEYFASDNVTTLKQIYSNISQKIVELSFTEQVSVVSGNFEETRLYPDSYLSYSYDFDAIPYGLIIPSETNEFGNLITNGTFFVPNDTGIVEANVISYSGSKWTNRIKLNNSVIFELGTYGNDFLGLGDPYVINIPTNQVSRGNNLIEIKTGANSNDFSGGSSSDKVIFTLVKSLSGYSKIVSNAVGCDWTVEVYTGENISFKVPSNYSGTKKCYYTSAEISFNENDAIDNAIYDLINEIDFNNDKRVDTRFSAEDLSISSTEVNGIPFTWETEAQVRIWR